jgi:hypothetical protein
VRSGPERGGVSEERGRGHKTSGCPGDRLHVTRPHQVLQPEQTAG